MSPASSSMSPRRTGTAPWAPWRQPYAILLNAYGNRRLAANEAILPRPQGSRTSFLWLLPHSLDLVPLTPGGVKKTPMTAADVRSLHRSRRRRCRAPRLASCLSHTGPGSREFPAPTTRRWGEGASGILREQSGFHRTKTSRPTLEGAPL
jgi:hypothetical protein